MLAAQLLILVIAMVMARWTHMSLGVTIMLPVSGLGVLKLGSCSSAMPSFGAIVLALLGPLAFLVELLWLGRFVTVDVYHVILVALLGTGPGLLAATLPSSRPRLVLTRLCGLWLGLAASLLTWIGYEANNGAMFFSGLAALAVLALVSTWLFHLPASWMLVANTFVLLAIGLPIADRFTRTSYADDPQAALHGKYFLFEKARKDPASFAQWWRCYLNEWQQLAVIAPDPSGQVKFILAPHSNGKLFESRFTINRLGFRGPEFMIEKGNAYRIVALGESTTFGCTLFAADRPWPEVLEDLIRERIPSSRPVQVINAGVPAYSLRDNLARLARDILPLKPDLIISYHGINGFYLLDASVPKTSGPPPPAFRPRPLRLLADAEYRLKMIYYRKSQTSLADRAPSLSSPTNSQYAAAYRDLIQITRTNGIRLALASYSMAVNSQSEAAAAEFYRTAAPGVHRVVKVNAVHTELLRQLCTDHPETIFVDTHPSLDGCTDMFIDLGHFTQHGRQRLAENIFQTLRPALERDLQPTASIAR